MLFRRLPRVRGERSRAHDASSSPFDADLERVWRHAAYLNVRDNLRHTRYCCHFARALLALHPNARAEVVMPAMVLHDVGWSTVPDDKLMRRVRSTRPAS